MRSKIEEYIVDSIAMLLALITIFIAYLNNMTLSYLVNTKWEPLFITMIATTSLSLFNIKSWRLPSIFILLVASFSAIRYPLFHTIFAVMFFITSYYSMYKTKRYVYWSLTSIPAIIMIFMNYNLLYIESLCILSIALSVMMFCKTVQMHS